MTVRAASAAIVTIVALASALPAPAAAWCRMTTSERRPTASEPCVLPDSSADPPEHFLEWRNPCSQLTLSLAAPSDDLSEAEVRQVFESSIEAWESVECSGEPLGIDIDLIDERSSCVAPLYRDGGSNVNTVMFVLDWGDRRYDPAAFAVTTVWFRKSTGEILDVDMEINERRGPYGICPADEGCRDRVTVDLQNVVTHELGHYLGVAHSTDPEATMFASSVAGEVIKRDLGADDIEGLCTIYPPGVPAGECDYAPSGGQRLDCEQGCTCSAPGRGQRSAPWALFVGVAALLVLRRRG